MDIEVFMKELYYEEIEQRVAYDLTSLFCKFHFKPQSHANKHANHNSCKTYQDASLAETPI